MVMFCWGNLTYFVKCFTGTFICSIAMMLLKVCSVIGNTIPLQYTTRMHNKPTDPQNTISPALHSVSQTLKYQHRKGKCCLLISARHSVQSHPWNWLESFTLSLSTGYQPRQSVHDFNTAWSVCVPYHHRLDFKQWWQRTRHWCQTSEPL